MAYERAQAATRQAQTPGADLGNPAHFAGHAAGLGEALRILDALASRVDT